MNDLWIIKIINSFFILLIAGAAGFLSMAFYLGTQESHRQLVKELPLSFIIRFGLLSVLGIMGIGILVFFNYIVNKTILKEKSKINLKQLAIMGCLATILMAFLGTVVFFFA